MNEKLTVGIIGLGVGKGHLVGYRADSNVKVKTVCDFNTEKLDEVAKEYPEIHRTVDPKSILLDPEINIVSVASYDNFHAEQIITALDQGKHVFAEKPVCLFPEELKGIADALKRNPICHFSSNLILRRYPRFLELKRKLSEGILGEVYSIEGDYLYGRLHKILEGWRGQLPYYSILLGGAIHLVDLVLWLTQDRVLEVTAMGNQIASRGTQFRFNDFIVGMMRMQSGAIFKVSANFGSVTPHFHEVKIYGTRGTFFNRPEAGEIILARDKEKQPGPVFLNEPYPGTLKGDFLADFLEGIRGRKTQSVTPQEVFDAMAVCFALEKSANTGETVKVGYLN